MANIDTITFVLLLHYNVLYLYIIVINSIFMFYHVPVQEGYPAWKI